MVTILIHLKDSPVDYTRIIESIRVLLMLSSFFIPPKLNQNYTLIRKSLLFDDVCATFSDSFMAIEKRRSTSCVKHSTLADYAASSV